MRTGPGRAAGQQSASGGYAGPKSSCLRSIERFPNVVDTRSRPVTLILRIASIGRSCSFATLLVSASRGGQGGEAQVADYDYHGRLARLLWEQQLADPLAKVKRTIAEPTAVASTNLRQRYLRAEEFVIGLIGVALLRLSATDGLSAAERSRLADPLLQQLQEFMWQRDGRGTVGPDPARQPPGRPRRRRCLRHRPLRRPPCGAGPRRRRRRYRR
jgi:hypothetical protein